MSRFLIRRIISMVLLLVAVSIAAFALFTFGPADPAADSCGKTCTPERIAQARVALGMNKPAYQQYLEYMRGIIMGRHMGVTGASRWCAWPCFGRSFQNSQYVWDAIKQALPYTMSLAIGAAIIWLIVGVALGMTAGLHRGKLIDRLAVGLSAVGVSMPIPVLGLTMILIINVRMHFPYSSAVRTAMPWDAGGPVKFLQTFLLPWVTLAAVSAATYVRLTRTSMLETMGEDYIRTARAKGLPRRSVTFKHGLRAAITPIVTIFGMDLGILLGGAMMTESIFSLPGLGKLSVNAVNSEDLPTIMAVVMFAAFFITVANIVVDVVYAVIDPRVRLT